VLNLFCVAGFPTCYDWIIYAKGESGKEYEISLSLVARVAQDRSTKGTSVKRTVAKLLEILSPDASITRIEVEGSAAQGQGESIGLKYEPFFLTPENLNKVWKPSPGSATKLVLRRFDVTEEERNSYSNMGVAFQNCQCGKKANGNPKAFTKGVEDVVLNVDEMTANDCSTAEETTTPDRAMPKYKTTPEIVPPNEPGVAIKPNWGGTKVAALLGAPKCRNCDSRIDPDSVECKACGQSVAVKSGATSVLSDEASTGNAGFVFGGSSNGPVLQNAPTGSSSHKAAINGFESGATSTDVSTKKTSSFDTTSGSLNGAAKKGGFSFGDSSGTHAPVAAAGTETPTGGGFSFGGDPHAPSGGGFHLPASTSNAPTGSGGFSFGGDPSASFGGTSTARSGSGGGSQGDTATTDPPLKEEESGAKKAGFSYGGSSENSGTFLSGKPAPSVAAGTETPTPVGTSTARSGSGGGSKGDTATMDPPFEEDESVALSPAEKVDAPVEDQLVDGNDGVVDPLFGELGANDNLTVGHPLRIQDVTDDDKVRYNGNVGLFSRKNGNYWYLKGLQPDPEAEVWFRRAWLRKQLNN